jgi:Sulfotransferase domain
LLRQYPEAKVILTVRDPARWYDSARQTIYFVRQAFPGWTSVVFPRMRVFRQMLDRIIWDGTFEGRFEDRDFAIAAFERHNEQVRRDVPAGRLLVYEVSEGWEPLCAFLGVPVPEGKPFPHLNDAAEFRARIERGARAVRTIAGVALVLAALAAAALAVAIILAVASLGNS